MCADVLETLTNKEVVLYLLAQKTCQNQHFTSKRDLVLPHSPNLLAPKKNLPKPTFYPQKGFDLFESAQTKMRFSLKSLGL